MFSLIEVKSDVRVKMVINFKRFHKITKHDNITIQIRKYCNTKSGNVNKKGNLDEETAYKLVLNLDESQRATLKRAVYKFESDAVRRQLEADLAATRWRTMFDHPSASELAGVHPTGAYCSLPDVLTKRTLDHRRPDKNDLWKLFVVNAIPFFGFGFLDNFIMISAGDYLELGIGMVFFISTMAAAALGNTISDLVGIISAHYIEKGCVEKGLRPPKLSNAQMQMKSTKSYARWGKLVGITVGCLLGMCPLLFMDKKDENGKRS